MNHLSKAIMIALSASMVPITAPSEEMPARGPIPFAVYDKDGNDLISEEEFYTVRGERMAKHAAEGRPMRGAADAPAFFQFDTNSDGQLTEDELVAGQQAQMQKRRGMGMGRGMGPVPVTVQEPNQPRGPIPFTVYDKDGNGLISEEEFDTVRGERMAKRAAEGRPMRGAANAPTFSQFDTNSDGQLTEDELVAGQEAQMQKRRGMGMGPVPVTVQEPNQPTLQNSNNLVEKVEVKGQIMAINDNLLTIKVFETEHFQPGGNTVEADIQNAQFEHGNRTDLHQNALVEIEGRWDGNRLYATEVEFED
jgi:Ca2+-binding EF-hand superfamily protein